MATGTGNFTERACVARGTASLHSHCQWQWAGASQFRTQKASSMPQKRSRAKKPHNVSPWILSSFDVLASDKPTIEWRVAVPAQVQEAGHQSCRRLPSGLHPKPRLARSLRQSVNWRRHQGRERGRLWQARYVLATAAANETHDPSSQRESHNETQSLGCSRPWRCGTSHALPTCKGKDE